MICHGGGKNKGTLNKNFRNIRLQSYTHTKTETNTALPAVASMNRGTHELWEFVTFEIWHV